MAGACRKSHNGMLKLIFTVNIQSKGFILAFTPPSPFPILLSCCFPIFPEGSSRLSLSCHMYSGYCFFCLMFLMFPIKISFSHLMVSLIHSWHTHIHTQIQTQILFMRENTLYLPYWLWLTLLNIMIPVPEKVMVSFFLTVNFFVINFL